MPTSNPKSDIQPFTVLVDGGASGCRLQVRDSNGRVCATAQTGPASLSLGADNAWQNIELGFTELLLQIPHTENWLPQKLVMGLAGALHDERRQQLLALAHTHADHITLVTDGHAQLLGASGGKAGACLAVGTGSVLHWLTGEGVLGMAGGWGFPVGDEASGAWLGQAAINRYTRWYDNRDAARSNDPFYASMRNVLGSDLTSIQNWTTCKSPTQLASLAPELVRLLESNSGVAAEIFNAGGQALEQLLWYAPAGLPLYLTGGLAKVYSTRLIQPWQDRLQVAHGDVFDGLWHLANKP